MAVLFCPECGASIEGERRYCPICGEALQPKEPNRAPEPNFMQSGYTQPGYTQPQVNPDKFNGCAIAGLVLGIISLVTCCTSCIALLVAGAGLTCSILGLRSYSKKGCAVAGLICSIAGLLMSLFMTLTILAD